MMRAMTGMQLAREVHALRSDLPVILYTGLSESLARDEIDDAGLRALITKPVEPHDLYALLQMHLPTARFHDRA